MRSAVIPFVSRRFYGIVVGRKDGGHPEDLEKAPCEGGVGFTWINTMKAPLMKMEGYMNLALCRCIP